MTGSHLVERYETRASCVVKRRYASRSANVRIRRGKPAAPYDLVKSRASRGMCSKSTPMP